MTFGIIMIFVFISGCLLKINIQIEGVFFVVGDIAVFCRIWLAMRNMMKVMMKVTMVS